MSTLQELYPDEYKPEEEIVEKKKKRGRPKKQGVDVIDRTGIEDPLASDPQVELYRSRIEIVVKGGKSEHYFGKQILLDNIEKLNNEEIKEMYSIYETKRGNEVTKSLGNTMINILTHVADELVKLQTTYELDTKQLSDELNDNELLKESLNEYACESYHMLGSWLVPVTVGASIVRNLKKKQVEIIITPLS